MVRFRETNRFNRRHGLFGPLFSGRYKSLIVDGSSSGYLKRVYDFVHLNRARARLVGPTPSVPGGVCIEVGQK